LQLKAHGLQRTLCHAPCLQKNRGASWLCAALTIVLASQAHAAWPPVTRSALQDVLEYLPPSAHALGWQHEGVAARWYAPGQGAPRAATPTAWQDCTGMHSMMS